MTALDARAQAIAAIVTGGIIASDYDGCLSPIYPVPAKAYRSPGVLPAFQLLGAAPKVLAITISGRPRHLTADGEPGIEEFFRTNQVHRLDPTTGTVTAELETPPGVFDPEGLEYTLSDGRRGRIHVIASHGADPEPALMETDADRGFFAKITPLQEATRAKVLKELPLALAHAHPRFPVAYDVDPANPNRIYLEVKPEGVAVHTRTLSASHPDEASRIRDTAAAFYTGKSVEWGVPLYATPGSEVLEIQVRRASKGTPIDFLHAKFPGRPITYTGDDITDLDAFRALNPGDTAIIVGNKLDEKLAVQGPPEGVNMLRVPDPAALADFLDEVTASLPSPDNGHYQARPMKGRTNRPRRRPPTRH